MPTFSTNRQEITYREIQTHGYFFARNEANGDVIMSKGTWEVAVHPNGRFTEI